MTVFTTPRIRLALWALVGGVATVAYRSLNGLSLDGPYFARSAHQLVHGVGLHVYADQGLQAGPWQLLWFALAGSGRVFAAASGALAAVVLVAGLRSLRAWRGAHTGAALEAAVVLLAVGWGTVSGTYAGGHPAELVIPATWAVAASLAVRDRPLAAGLVIGFGAGWETWGMLGVPVLLLLPSARRAIAAGAVAVTGAVAVYLPFVLVGPFRMGEAQWPVNPHTLVHALIGSAPFSWTDRLAQGVFVVGCGSILALRLRRRPDSASVAAWALPAVVMLAKITTEPQPRDYYWLPLQALLLVGVAALRRRDAVVVAVALPALALAVVVPLQVWPVELATLVLFVLALAFGTQADPVAASAAPTTPPAAGLGDRDTHLELGAYVG